MKKEIGYIGLGKMGLGQVALLCEQKWRVVAWNRSLAPREDARRSGAEIRATVVEVIVALKKPRLVWLMVPHTIVDEMLAVALPHLERGDTVIDGGNSFYKESERRAAFVARRGIHFLDVGTSGGPSGARRGACLMIGGSKNIFKKYAPLFQDLSGDSPHSNIPRNVGGYAYMGKSGAGHFVKMVHNGIEYGTMQALGEGFEVLKKSGFNLNLRRVAELYNKKSVIESRLVGWLARALKEHGENLKGVSDEVAQSGEGLWTVETAKKLGVPVEVIKKSLEFRLNSKGNPSFTGKVVSALRNQFGGHQVKEVAKRGSSV